MKEATKFDFQTFSPAGTRSGQDLLTLLALIGARSMDGETLRERIGLTPSAFNRSLRWLQQEYLVDVVSSLEGDRVSETVILTDLGEGLLVEMLERTCELPEFR